MELRHAVAWLPFFSGSLSGRALEHRLPSLCAKQACSLFPLTRLKARWAHRHACLCSSDSLFGEAIERWSDGVTVLALVPHSLQDARPCVPQRAKRQQAAALQKLSPICIASRVWRDRLDGVSPYHFADASLRSRSSTAFHYSIPPMLHI
jgi:hypothetical protein